MERWEQSLREEKSVRKDQTVAEMDEEVLARQAKSLVDRSGQSLEDALEAVAKTEAGRQLRELANGEHRHEKAQNWQTSMLWDRAEERLMHYIASDAQTHLAHAYDKLGVQNRSQLLARTVPETHPGPFSAP